MWYASPPEPCWTQMPKARWFFLCAATTMSGASAADTVPRFDRIEPKSLETTLTVAPLADAHWFPILVTDGARFASVQIVSEIADCFWTVAEAVESAAPATRVVAR